MRINKALGEASIGKHQDKISETKQKNTNGENMQQNETNTRKENTIQREQLLSVDNSEGDEIMDNNNIGRLRDSPKENNQLQVDKAHGDNIIENSVNDTVGKENYMMLEDKPLDETEVQGKLTHVTDNKEKQKNMEVGNSIKVITKHIYRMRKMNLMRLHKIVLLGTTTQKMKKIQKGKRKRGYNSIKKEGIHKP